MEKWCIHGKGSLLFSYYYNECKKCSMHCFVCVSTLVAYMLQVWSDLREKSEKYTAQYGCGCSCPSGMGIRNGPTYNSSLQNGCAASLKSRAWEKNLGERYARHPYMYVSDLSAMCVSLHCLQVCHGDIKSENVMLTSWNWVLLTDFANFKPAILPEVQLVCLSPDP